MSNLDPTTHTLACATLAVLFRREFKELVRRHLAAAEGLDLDHVRTYLHEAADAYSVDVAAPADALEFELELATSTAYRPRSRPRATLAAALDADGALEVGTPDETLFVRKDGEWVPVND